MSTLRAKSVWHSPASLRGAGRIDLTFSREPEGNTYLSKQYASYPFHICRPYIYQGDPVGMASLALQSLSGGVYQSESLSQSIKTALEAKAHVTTQSSTIIHSMETGHAEQHTLLEAHRGSFLEYMPNPAILFPHARYLSQVTAKIGPKASLLASEGFMMHDPKGSGDRFDWLLGDFAIYDLEGGLLARDRFHANGADFDPLRAPTRAGTGVQGIFLAATREQPGDLLVDAFRKELNLHPSVYAGASVLPNDCGAWVRILSPDAVGLADAVYACWKAARFMLTQTIPPKRRR